MQTRTRLATFAALAAASVTMLAVACGSDSPKGAASDREAAIAVASAISSIQQQSGGPPPSAGAEQAGVQGRGSAQGSVATAAPSSRAASVTAAPQARRSAGKDPCSLATREEVQKIIGAELSEGRVYDDGSFLNCEYENPKLGETVTIAYHSGSASQAQRSFDDMKKYSPVGVQDVSGIGEKAFFIGLLRQVHVLDRGKYVSVQVVFLSGLGGKDQEQATAIAKLAISRLQ